MKKMMKSKGMAKGGKRGGAKKMAKGGMRGGPRKMMSGGGKAKAKGSKRGGATMTLAAIRAAAKKKGFRLVKA